VLLAFFVCLNLRKDHDEIVGLEAIVELVNQNFIPAILAGVWRAGQRKEQRAARNAGCGARLNCRGADLFKGNAMKDGGETVNFLVINGAESLRRHVAARKPRATRSEEHTSELQSRENLVCRL